MAEDVKRFREELRRAVRSFWASDSGAKVSTLLSEKAFKTGFADEMKTIMERVRSEIRSAASKANLSEEYTRVWGKEKPKRE